MLTSEEKKLLKIIDEKKLVRKSELQKLLDGTENVPLSAINGLINKGYVANVSPIGEKSFIITKEGLKALKREA